MFSKTFNEDCFGKSDCFFNMVKNIDTSKTKNPKCKSDKAKVYIQFECEVNRDIIEKNQKEGLLTATIAVIASILFTLVIWMLKLQQNLDEKIYDVQNVTACDFTTELRITNKMW